MMFKSYFPERHSGSSKIWGGDVLWLAEEKKALSGSGKDKKCFQNVAAMVLGTI